MDNQDRTILLVEGRAEDDASLAAPLEKAGFNVVAFDTGRAAVAWAQDKTPDLIVFDASSMRSSGTRICRRLRGVLERTPLIHCREEGTSQDAQALADVYLERPFTGRKLLNRVRDLLPADPHSEEVVRFGHLVLYRGKRAIDVGGQGEQRLTPKLAALLETFLRHPGQLVTRLQLMQDVWQTDYVGDTRTLDVHIRWVRELIEADPSDPQLLVTVRGQGFVLQMPEMSAS